MRIDLANFEIEMFRSELTAQSVEYEKEKFAQALALQGGISKCYLCCGVCLMKIIFAQFTFYF